MICTYGKVIQRTYFKKEPKEKEKIVSWIEAPYLLEAVTTDKCRFQNGNKVWEGFFRRTQNEFSKWLEETGLIARPLRRELDYNNLEKEINSILKNIPELSFFTLL
jgi:sulfite reductase alpha subunit-like flavoprotein